VRVLPRFASGREARRPGTEAPGSHRFLVTGLRSRPQPGASDTGHAGFTLIEIAVVILVLALVATLVAPSIGRFTVVERPDGRLASLTTHARATAVRRAEGLELQVDSSGEWLLSASRDGTILGRGRVSGRVQGPLTIVISALGACTIVDGSAGAGRWDSLRCAPGPTPAADAAPPVAESGATGKTGTSFGQ
jgi:prepilin-type N-terminal cleavage/methylation domain-containing protein